MLVRFGADRKFAPRVSAACGTQASSRRGARFAESGSTVDSLRIASEGELCRIVREGPADELNVGEFEGPLGARGGQVRPKDDGSRVALLAQALVNVGPESELGSSG